MSLVTRLLNFFTLDNLYKVADQLLSNNNEIDDKYTNSDINVALQHRPNNSYQMDDEELR